MTDTPENREYMESEFEKWKNSTNDSNCDNCQYKYECNER